MHLRRIACLLLGCWLAGTLVVGWIATSNFTAADTVLATTAPEIRNATARLEPGQAHMFLRYLVAVENGEYFMTWELAEFALLAALALVLFLDRQNKRLAVFPAALLLLVAFQHFRLTREIIWLGEEMVLAGGGASARIRSQFSAMHTLYGISVLIELLVGIALAVWMSIRRRERRSRRSAMEALEPRTVTRRAG